MSPAEMAPVNYAVRLRAPYESLRHVVSAWSLKSEKLVCYEHPEPDNIHIHLLLKGVYDTADALKKVLWKTNSDIKGAGKLSFKTTFKSPQGIVTPIDDETIAKYITYMSKGKYEPKYVTGYDSAFIHDCKTAWVNHIRRSHEQSWYDAFVKRVKECEEAACIRITEIEQIKPIAVAYAISKHGIINLAARRDMSMLITTYYYEYGNRHDEKLMDKIKLPYQ